MGFETQNLKTNPKPEEVRELFFLATRLLAAKLITRGLEIQTPRPPLSMKEKANEIRERLKGTERGERLARLEQEARDGNPQPLFDAMRQMQEFLDRTIKP